MDLQRNPDDEGEVRLLYHRVVAPTKGVLGWASGDSLSFDLVFTDLDMMAANDVLDLVKVSKHEQLFVVYWRSLSSFAYPGRRNCYIDFPHVDKD